MKKIAFCFFILLLLFFPLLAQPPHCITDELHLKPETSAAQNRYQAEYESYLSQSHSARSPYVIPTVVHVLYSPGNAPISDSIVMAQMGALNRTFQRQSDDSVKTPIAFQPLFANANVEFRLAQIDPYGCPTQGINQVETPLADHQGGQEQYMKALIQWPPDQYLNVWIVERINNGFAQGYATLPWELFTSPELDGIVLSNDIVGYIPNHPYLEGEVATHEVGHWLGLYHVFQDGCSGTTPQDCAAAGDRVCDTPQSATSSFSCANALNSCSDSPNDLPDFEASYMSYSPDSCKTMFSQGQVTRMHFFLDSIRSYIHSPANLAATGVDGSVSQGCLPFPAFTSDIKTLCPGQSVQFTDATQGSPTGWNWTFSGGIPATSTQQNPVVTFPTPGNFDVTLNATNATGSASTTEVAFIHAYLPAPPPILQSFEGGLPHTDGWEIRNGDSQSTWAITDQAANHGSRSLYVDHFYMEGNGTTDDLYLPAVDLSGLNQTRLTFDRAYRRVDNFQRDSLRVEVSTDCGASWNTEWEATTLALATAGGYTGDVPFVPTLAQWKSDSLDLSPYLGQSDVRIRFQFQGSGGQNIYLDQINLDATIISDREVPHAFNCSVTSPFRESFLLQFFLESPQPAVLNLYDLQGRQHWTQSVMVYHAGQHKIKVADEKIGQLPDGIYVLEVATPAQGKRIKLVKL